MSWLGLYTNGVSLNVLLSKQFGCLVYKHQQSSTVPKTPLVEYGQVSGGSGSILL